MVSKTVVPLTERVRTKESGFFFLFCFVCFFCFFLFCFCFFFSCWILLAPGFQLQVCKQNQKNDKFVLLFNEWLSFNFFLIFIYCLFVWFMLCIIYSASIISCSEWSTFYSLKTYTIYWYVFSTGTNDQTNRKLAINLKLQRWSTIGNTITYFLYMYSRPSHT